MKTKLTWVLIWIIILLASIIGTVLLFRFFLTFLAGIIGIGFILLIAGAIISVVERLSERTKGR